MLEISCEQKTGSDCLIFTKLCYRFRWTCHTHGIFLLFLQLATQHFVAVAGFKTGVLHVKSFLQLVSQQKVARKNASCNMALTDCEVMAYGQSVARSVRHDREPNIFPSDPTQLSQYKVFYHMTTVRIFTATKLSQITSRGVVCAPSRAGRLFPALLALSRTALIRGFCEKFCY